MVVVIAEVGLTSVLTFVLVFGVAPGLFLRLLVLIYPRDDPRRRELVAQLYTLGRVERLLFVGEQFETALFEGTRQRLANLRRMRAGRGNTKDQGTSEEAHQEERWLIIRGVQRAWLSSAETDHTSIGELAKSGRLVTKWVRSDMGTRLETYVVHLDREEDDTA